MWLECAYKIKHSVGIQRVKNDKADSKAIAEYAMRNYDKMILYKPQSASLTCLREVFLYRHSLVRLLIMSIRQTKKLSILRNVKYIVKYQLMFGI